jgi:APA family basic amino acid/polyamine antiporter
LLYFIVSYHYEHVYLAQKSDLDVERPYMAFGYPILPVFYIITGIWLFALASSGPPLNILYGGLAITLMGIPLYLLLPLAARKK